MKFVSVIIPNYNHSNYLRERIDSILNQTYQNFELIILDDCSIDNSRQIIENYRNHPKISHIIYNETNSGSTFKQWNKGISLAKGKWVWIAESDDVADFTFLETLINEITDDNIVLSYCQSLKLNSNSRVTGSWIDQTLDHKTDFTKGFISVGRDFIIKDLINKNVIPNASAVIFRKDIFYKVNKADENIKYNSDWLLWMKILIFGKVNFCSKELNHFRYHDQSVIANARKDDIPFIRKFDILMFNKFLEYLLMFNEKSLFNTVRLKLSFFNQQEFRFLYDKGIYSISLSHLFKGLIQSDNKFFYLLRNIKYLLKKTF